VDEVVASEPAVDRSYPLTRLSLMLVASPAVDIDALRLRTSPPC
jgi:hypothetical protein